MGKDVWWFPVRSIFIAITCKCRESSFLVEKLQPDSKMYPSEHIPPQSLADKYREGNLKSTLQREFNEPNPISMQAVLLSNPTWDTWHRLEWRGIVPHMISAIHLRISRSIVTKKPVQQKKSYQVLSGYLVRFSATDYCTEQRGLLCMVSLLSRPVLCAFCKQYWASAG